MPLKNFPHIMKLRNIKVYFFVFSVVFFCITPFIVSGETIDDLKKIIDQKGAALKELEDQRKELQKQLDVINNSNNKLSGEIQYFNTSINQLNVLMQSNKLTVEKLELEIESLRDDIQWTHDDILNKKKTIGRLFTELQRRDKENLLTIFLKNRSLAEAIGEVQTISDLNNSLLVNLEELTQLENDLAEKINKQENKKYSKEIESENIKNRQYILSDQKKEKQTLLSQTKNQEKLYEKQINELKKMQDEISSEIEEIENVLRRSIDPNFLPLARKGVLEWPVPDGRLTQAYGRTSFAARNYKSQYHNGIDIGRFLGAEIIAAEEGTVINVGNQDLYCRGAAYGKFIVIKHTNGLTTLYGHLSRSTVSIGEKVKRGDIVGYMGRTGWATGPHLHFTVFASQTITPARPGFPEGTQSSRSCGPMPVGGDLDPTKYIEIP